jgi:hypothetical protein
MTFKEFLEHSQTGAKSGLYPLGYAGIGLYPPQDYLTHTADAITYISLDDRLYKKANGDGKPFSIKHLAGPRKL